MVVFSILGCPPGYSAGLFRRVSAGVAEETGSFERNGGGVKGQPQSPEYPIPFPVPDSGAEERSRQGGDRSGGDKALYFPALYSSAEAMKPRKMGCASSGRDFSSGWN